MTNSYFSPLLHVMPSCHCDGFLLLFTFFLFFLFLFGGIKIVVHSTDEAAQGSVHENSHDLVNNIGVNMAATHKLPPEAVLQMLYDYRINSVKLSDDAQPSILAGSDIQAMLAIPNDQLSTLAESYDRAKDWVKHNVTAYHYNGGVHIKYVAVGNEPFLASHNDSYLNATFPALRNIQTALNESGLGESVKATVPFNADVCGSPKSNPVPSAGRFRRDIAPQMNQIVKFLRQSNSPFTVNIHPFLRLRANQDFPLDYAFFDGVSIPIVDGGVQYTNIFDANFDTLVSSLRAVGLGDMPIIVGEVGWPTRGDVNANLRLAQRFYAGLLSRLAANTGTPLRPGHIDVYMFELLDEDNKSVAPGGFERHWGIFNWDGQPKFPMDHLRSKTSSSKLPQTSSLAFWTAFVLVLL